MVQWAAAVSQCHDGGGEIRRNSQISGQALDHWTTHPPSAFVPTARLTSQQDFKTQGGRTATGKKYLNECGGRLGSGDGGSVGQAGGQQRWGRQRRLLCQEERLSRIGSHRELRKNLGGRERGGRGEMRTLASPNEYAYHALPSS